ncbi:hypothetical protein GCM10007886_15230 [Methylobacterium gregans]|nr:hypothetical protein GCM10007886_15230 [Methylobacterium gregans]
MIEQDGDGQRAETGSERRQHQGAEAERPPAESDGEKAAEQRDRNVVDHRIDLAMRAPARIQEKPYEYPYRF